MNLLDDLISMSRWAGERFDLIQAGGGNTSMKTRDGSLWVKASGIQLANVSSETGFCQLDRHALCDLLTQLEQKTDWEKRQLDTFAIDQAQAAVQSGIGRPSIETLLHAQMKSYTLHTHPIALVRLASQANWQELFSSLFPEALCVSYETPGAALALALSQELKQKPDTRIVLLQNHGLIVSTNSADETMALTTQIVDTVEQKLGMDLSVYRNTTTLSSWIRQHTHQDVLAYYCNDRTVHEYLERQPNLFGIWPVCPDQLVYCGPEPLVVSGTLSDDVLKNYLANWDQYPRVVLWDGACYLIGTSLGKCQEMMDVLRFHLLVVDGDPKLPLPKSELTYLMNWSAEKYRQKV